MRALLNWTGSFDPLHIIHYFGARKTWAIRTTHWRRFTHWRWQKLKRIAACVISHHLPGQTVIILKQFPERNMPRWKSGQPVACCLSQHKFKDNGSTITVLYQTYEVFYVYSNFYFSIKDFITDIWNKNNILFQCH